MPATPMPAVVELSITAQNTFTNPLVLQAGQAASISIIRTSFTGTVVLQRQFRGQSTWQDVEDSAGTIGWTSKDYQGTYQAEEACSIRLGVKTGGFTGTSVLCRLGVG